MRIPIRIGDVLVYLLVFLLTAFSLAGLYQMGRNTVTSQVVVEIDGVVWGTYDLPLEGEEREILVDAGETRFNILILSDSGVYIKEANCPDQLCVSWGRINRPGQTIVCLPHKVVIRIIGSQEGEPPLDGISS